MSLQLSLKFKTKPSNEKNVEHSWVVHIKGSSEILNLTFWSSRLIYLIIYTVLSNLLILISLSPTVKTHDRMKLILRWKKNTNDRHFKFTFDGHCWPSIERCEPDRRRICIFCFWPSPPPEHFAASRGRRWCRTKRFRCWRGRTSRPSSVILSCQTFLV